MKKHLIIIDEDKSLAEGIALALRFDFDEISLLQSPLFAWNLLKHNRKAVVLSEIRFSTVDGMEMICGLQKAYPASRFIILSAYFSEKAVQDLKSAGVTTVLEKPIQMEKLKNALRKEKTDELF